MNTKTASATQSRHAVANVTQAHSRFGRNQGLLASLGFAALLCVPSITGAQVAPPLGVAHQFGALGNSGVTGSTGTGTIVNGDVGSSPTPSISNFPPSTSAPPFTLHNTGVQPDGVVVQARADANTAYLALNQGPGIVLADNLATVGPLTSGIYSLGAADLPTTSTLVLNGAGIFVFNVSSSLTMNVLSTVSGTANPCNVYWQVGTSATLNGINFFGTVIADANITVGSGSNVTGRVLAGRGATGAVTMAGSGGNTIGGCSAPIVVPPPGLAGLSKAFLPAAIGVNGISTLTINLSNSSVNPRNLVVPLTDTLPVGVVIAAIPNAITTCGVGGLGGGVVSATPGGNTVSLSANSSVPGGAPGACSIMVDVTAPAGGSFLNTLGVCALQISDPQGVPVCNVTPATATLIVVGLGNSGGVPTLSELAMILLGAFLAVFGAAAIRRRRM